MIIFLVHVGVITFLAQARRLFLFPKETPTVVATSFCVESLFNAYEITKNKNFKKLALSSADFIINDLNRLDIIQVFCFLYSPYKGNNTVYNASLLGAKTLSLCYKYSGKEIYRQTAEKVSESSM